MCVKDICVKQCLHSFRGDKRMFVLQRLARARLGSVSVPSVLASVFEAVCFALFLAVGRMLVIVVPWSPVPFTLQTMMLSLTILALESRAWRAVATYILLGLSGVPVFAFGGGLAYILSPTFGYLLGFLVAAFVAGRLARQAKNLYSRVLVSLAVLPPVYCFGVLWLSIHIILASNCAPLEAFIKAILAGLAPFLLWDSMKALVAALLYDIAVRASSRSQTLV